ncbi:MAG: hypothetical protein AB1791_01180 [Chloroflexota bacterium]
MATLEELIHRMVTDSEGNWELERGKLLAAAGELPGEEMAALLSIGRLWELPAQDLLRRLIGSRPLGWQPGDEQ